MFLSAQTRRACPSYLIIRSITFAV
jgi:hypothetical protein